MLNILQPYADAKGWQVRKGSLHKTAVSGWADKLKTKYYKL